VTGAPAADGSGPFRFEYDPGTIRYGAGATAALGEELAALGLDRALVVTGTTVGRTAAVMDPVRAGLGDRLAGVFAETTPEKRLSTAVAGAAAAAEHEADALVAVGGGSSIDVAKAVAAVAGREDDADALAGEFVETGSIETPADPLPILAVPTTLAGADLSMGAGLSADPEAGLVDVHVDGGHGDPALFPVAGVYDPDLFSTTPRSVLAGAAMNGFDKGIETLYSRHATAITDATAARGVGRFREGLLAFGGGADDGDGYRDGLPAAVEGLVLVQYGFSRPDATTMGPIHAVGQALSAAGVHQGTAHAITAPHVLEHVFAAGTGRPDLLASALDARSADSTGGDDAATPASQAVDAVTAVRDALGVPTRLRDVEGGPDRDALPSVAETVADHRFLANGPPGYEPDAEDALAVLEAAW